MANAHDTNQSRRDYPSSQTSCEESWAITLHVQHNVLLTVAADPRMLRVGAGGVMRSGPALLMINDP
jgi:hypothetical protein